jgi:lysylphosphatidylglycerol synthetase-like protein (DUF2156 family)
MTVLRELRRRPVTIVIVLALLGIGIAAIATRHHGAFSPDLAGVDAGDLRERHWWVLLTSTLMPGDVPQFVLAVVAAIFGIGTAERLMGSWRTLIAFLVTGVLASAIGVGLELLGAQVHEYWSTSVNELDTLDPLTPIAGALAWASAWASPFWRRRLRVLLLAGSAALLLYSGVPADLYLLIAVGIGLLAGRLLHPGPVLQFWRGSQHETRSLLALVNMVLALGPVLTLVSATRYGALSPLALAITGAVPRHIGRDLSCVASRLNSYCVGDLTRAHLGVGGFLVTLLPLAVQLVASFGLLSGRRVAVWILAGLGVLQSALAAWYFGIVPATGPAPVTPNHYVELGFWLVVGTLVPLADAVMLVLLRGLFPVRLTPQRRRGYAIALSAAVVAPIGLYLGIGWLIRAQLQPVPSFLTLVTQLPHRFVPVSFLRHQTLAFHGTTPSSTLLLQGVGPLFWVIVLVATFVIIQGGRGTVGEPQKAEQVRELLARGSGSLGWMATWPNNRMWISPDGRLGIAYRVVNGVAVTVSDPFGDSPDPDAALTAFLRFCDRQAWTPAFYSVHDDWRRRLANRGWSSVPVAEETVIDPRTFTLEGKSMHDLRYAVNRAGREGIHSVWGSWRDLPPRVTRQITALSEEWMADKDLPELGFTLGGLDELRDEQVLIGVALDAHETVLAVTSWLPVRHDGVLVSRTLDFMRRAASGSSGVMEYLISTALLRFGEDGLTSASLSGSPLAVPAGEIRSGALDRVLGLIGATLEPLYGFRSLLRFKRKFSPVLESMHLVVPDPVALPAVGLAVARCYLPGITVTQATRLVGSHRG